MPRAKGTKTVYFSKVKEAREALMAKSLELYELQVKIVQEALAAQDFESALKANQWLIEHMPSDEEGVTMIDVSIDKPKQTEQKALPAINIGFALGGIKSAPALPPAVIDALPLKKSDE